MFLIPFTFPPFFLLFYSGLIFSFLVHFVKAERIKSVGLGEWGRGKVLRGDMEGGTVIKRYYKENYF